MSVLSTLFPRRNPTLPQNDTIFEQTLRYKRLQDSQRKYVWTDELKNVVGVPMATKVPFDDKPSQTWLLLVFGVGLQLAENMLAVRLAQHRTDSKAHKKLQGRLDNIHKQMKSISTLQQDYIDHPDTNLTENFIILTRQFGQEMFFYDPIQTEFHFFRIHQYKLQLRWVLFIQ